MLLNEVRKIFGNVCHHCRLMFSWLLRLILYFLTKIHKVITKQIQRLQNLYVGRSYQVH